MTSGRVWVGLHQKVQVSGSSSGIVHIMVLRIILWSFCVILFHARGQGEIVNVLFSDNVEKELKYNQYIELSLH